MAIGANCYKKEKQRLFCQGHSGKKRFYKKVLDKWEEEGVDTDNPQFIVNIRKGFSFLEDDHLHTKSFSSTQHAMEGIKKIYTCGCDYCAAKPKL